MERPVDQGAGRTDPEGVARRAPRPPRASAAPDESRRSQHDLQAHLRALEERAGTIQSDLSDLEQSLPYQLLFDGREVSGLTRSRLESAIGALEHLWQGFNVLTEIMGEAESVVGNGAWRRREDLRNVEWLLFADSLELEGRRLTPDELLDELMHALRATAQILEETDHVWRLTVPALARCADQIRSLLRRAGDQIPAAQPLAVLRQLDAQAGHLRERTEVDPLGVAETFERDVLPRMEQARLRLTDELRQHRAVSAELARARARLAELRDLHARVVEEVGSVWSKIAQPRGLMAPPDPSYLTEPPMGLVPWLARLHALARMGSYRQVRRGLASWTQAANEAATREREVLEANREPLGRRQELRGLFSSLEAKAAALRVARDPGLADIGGRARAILYTGQTDLDEAEQLVKEYGDRLRVLNSKEVSYR